MNKYDEQIKYLTERPHAITTHWASGSGLFKMIAPFSVGSGCLTMIRDSPNSCKAFIKGKVDEKITAEIAADERIPKKYWDIKVEDLPVFKEWQEKIDIMQNS